MTQNMSRPRWQHQAASALMTAAQFNARIAVMACQPPNPKAQVPLQTAMAGLLGNSYTVSAPVISQESSTQATTTTSQACTGSHHFGRWCHTSISRGGIIAIIVIGSLVLLALLAAVLFGALAMSSRRRR